jgi:hypothetical protein
VATDLADIGREWVCWLVHKRHDTTELIAYLRRDHTITPEMRSLIADLLDGKIKAKPHRNRRRSSTLVAGTVRYYKLVLGGDDAEEWKKVSDYLADSGYKDEIETKGQITKAAKFATCCQFHLTPAQLSEIIHPRKARAKNR